uniref:hypothetical protein n=1 Tax=Micrococcus luteus TaxID=1270 RepID=UPI001642551B
VRRETVGEVRGGMVGGGVVVGWWWVMGEVEVTWGGGTMGEVLSMRVEEGKVLLVGDEEMSGWVGGLWEVGVEYLGVGEGGREVWGGEA